MVREGRWNEVFLGEKDADYPFALDFVRSNVPPEFLRRQYREAREGVDSGYCLGSQDEVGRCLGCGACVNEEKRQAIVRQRTTLQAGPTALLREVMTRKRRLKPAYLRVRLDRRLAGALPAPLDATLFRGLLARHPELVENMLSVRESLFTVPPNDRRYPPMTGETVFALKAWDMEGVRDSEIAATNMSGGFEIVGPAEGFTPGTFTRLHLEMHLPASPFPKPRAHLERYLREAYLPYSLRREEPRQGGEARYRFDVPPKGMRKKILFGGAFEVGPSGMDAWLEVGPGFEPLAFFEGFGGRTLYRQARVHVVGVEW
jgi:hypothetical protein